MSEQVGMQPLADDALARTAMYGTEKWELTIRILGMELTIPYYRAALEGDSYRHPGNAELNRTLLFDYVSEWRRLRDANPHLMV